MIVHLDGRPQKFHPGATVRDLAGRLEDAAREAWKRGELIITDADGHEVGSGGALSDGATYRTRAV
ncbi:MAG: hypothetical protein FJZ01_27660 [Candidatus Sericytochromatia bacterium]|nr:hypothetical protein [Candidatus Tanganyikabacteria bacterium]